MTSDRAVSSAGDRRAVLWRGVVLPALGFVLAGLALWKGPVAISAFVLLIVGLWSAERYLRWRIARRG